MVNETLLMERILMEGVHGGMLPGKFVKISLQLVHSERFCEYKFQPHQGISRIILKLNHVSRVMLRSQFTGFSDRQSPFTVNKTMQSQFTVNCLFTDHKQLQMSITNHKELKMPITCHENKYIYPTILLSSYPVTHIYDHVK